MRRQSRGGRRICGVRPPTIARMDTACRSITDDTDGRGGGIKNTPRTTTDTASFCEGDSARFTDESRLATSIRQVTQALWHFKLSFFFHLRRPELEPCKEPRHRTAHCFSVSNQVLWMQATFRIMKSVPRLLLWCGIAEADEVRHSTIWLVMPTTPPHAPGVLQLEIWRHGFDCWHGDSDRNFMVSQVRLQPIMLRAIRLG